jgi:hypothetical protein
VRSRIEARNAGGELVLSMCAMNLMRVRDAA